MKRLLIIQFDGAYFLYETLRLLEKSHSALKDFNLTILASPKAAAEVLSDTTVLVKGITTNQDAVLQNNFDLSINLSLDEESWDLHGKINSINKLGFSRKDQELSVPDLWSTFLLTIKSKAPFLTFHLQDIYKNILGIKKVPTQNSEPLYIKEIVLGRFTSEYFSETEVDLLTHYLATHTKVTLKTLSQVDVISDLSHTLFIGPPSLEALKICDAGGRGIFIGRRFQGFNLLPHDGLHYYVSTCEESAKAVYLLPIIESYLRNGKIDSNSTYSLYQLETENVFGAYWQSLNKSDLGYPHYQNHVVLWNFLLNLYEVNLDISKCTSSQLESLESNQMVLNKLIRLQDYALASIDIIYQESKAVSSQADRIDGHFKNLMEIDTVISKIAESHQFLRPFLDFYRIRRGQNTGTTLQEQVQHSYLAYSEEHHALTALSELFSVTLRKNEASISK